MSDPQKAKGGAKGLGRGLGSLLGQTGEGAFSKTAPGGEKALEALNAKMPSQKDPAIKQGFTDASKDTPAPAAPQVPNHLRVWQIGIEKIFPNPNQPRQKFEPTALNELAASIREKGIIQPLLVRKSADGDFEIIAGERRWRAAQLAGVKEVPAILRDSSEQEVSELALIENIQREDLNAIEEAEAYEYLIKKYNLTQAQIAQKVGKDRVTISNLLRILQLPFDVRQMVSDGDLSLGLAKVLLSLGDQKQMLALALKCKAEGLSVRALEKLVARIKEGKPVEDALPPSDRDRAAGALRDELQRLLGSKVQLDYASGKGKIVVHFYSDSELNQLADTLRDAWRN